MRKVILIFAASFCFSVNNYAQSIANYGDLLVYRRGLRNYVAEMHADGSVGKRQSLVRDANGNKMKFASVVDALNFTARQGWQVVAAYHPRSGHTHFILKK